MKRSITSSKISGTVIAPTSKSVAQRVIIATLLANGKSRLKNLTLCDDISAAFSAVEKLGANIENQGNDYLITSSFFTHPIKERRLFCGESGLLARVLAPIVALLSEQLLLIGCGSLLKRPVGMIVDTLRGLNVEISSRNGSLPLSIKGPMRGGEISIDATITSQFLTGLLMALPLLSEDSVIYVENLNSRPYIDLTIKLLQAFGIHIEHSNYAKFIIEGGQSYLPMEYSIEGDWSGASTLLVAGAIAGDIMVTNLDPASYQADKVILKILNSVGATVKVNRDSQLFSISVCGGKSLNSFEFDATDAPDLFPALVVLAACCSGTSKIKGVSRLIYKESNRALVLQQEFGKLGIMINLRGDYMFISGGEIVGGEASSHSDHRIAMALAVAALRSKEGITIDGTECVNKSYPAFWSDLNSLILNMQSESI